MRYVEVLPPPDLRPEVACLWVLEQDPGRDPRPEPIFPDGHAELIFNLGTPYRELHESADAQQPRSFVVGQIKRSLAIVPMGRVHIVGVRLESTSLHRLLGAPMSDLTDRSVPLTDLGRPDLVELEGRLHDAPDDRRRLSLLEGWLRTHLTPRPGEAGAALDLLRRSRGRLDLGRVAERVGCSARTLDRRFATEVGLTPKLFARQIRLQHVFELVASEPRPSWADIAVRCGFYDQPHLNREFRAFTGRSPEAFLRAPHELSDHLTGLA